MSGARPRFPVLLTLGALLLLGLLLGLGVWQVERLKWKVGLIDAAEAAAGEPPLPLDQALALDSPEFRRVIAVCRGLASAPYVELQSIEEGQAGVRLISACPAAAGVVLIDRGFIPDGVAARPPVRAGDAMPTALGGVLRRAPRAGPMTPAPAEGRFYGRDPVAMATALGAEGPLSPWTLYATTTINPELEALRPVAPPAAFSNNHLGYALTWFGLAAALIVFYVVLLRRRMIRKEFHP